MISPERVIRLIDESDDNSTLLYRSNGDAIKVNAISKYFDFWHIGDSESFLKLDELFEEPPKRKTAWDDLTEKEPISNIESTNLSLIRTDILYKYKSELEKIPSKG